MLELENIVVIKGDFRCELPEWKIGPGELALLIGKSGSGKTTLLNAIAGFNPLEQGTIRFDGRELQNLRPEKRRVAIAFQRAALFPHLSVFQNVEFGLKIQGLSASERRPRVESWLEKLGVSELADRLPHQISEGQSQRVALARAFITGFPVLLLDEPFSALDAELRVELGNVLRDLVNESRVCALMVTHHPEEMAKLADRKLVLDSGRVVSQN